MSKKTLVGFFAAAMVIFSATMAFAGGDAAVKAAGLWVYFGIAIACGVGIGMAALGTGISDRTARSCWFPCILIGAWGRPPWRTVIGGSRGESTYATSGSLSILTMWETAMTPTRPTPGSPFTIVAPDGTSFSSIILTALSSRTDIKGIQVAKGT